MVGAGRACADSAQHFSSSHEGSTMATASDSRDTNDPFDLGRFLEAQEPDYQRALSEIKGGEKLTHWMW